MSTIPAFINGEKVALNGENFQTICNPATGKIENQVHFATEEELENTLKVAQNAYHAWSQTPVTQKTRILFKLRELLNNNITELSEIITQEHGKVLDDAKGEVKRAIEVVEHYCGLPQLLKGSHSHHISDNMDCYNIRQPLGVCVGITPFNFPIMISTWMIIPAIACGNTFILKPSEKNPSAVIYLGQLLKEAGVPKGVVNIVNGNQHTAQYLITHPLVQAVSCVGSTPVAEHVYQTAVAHGKRAQTFGGAKNHAIVMPDCDINKVAPALLGAGYGAAGERCMAISVIVAVTDIVADQLVQKLSQGIEDLTISSGFNQQSDMGPLISAEHNQKVRQYIETGIAEGATIIVDGRQFTPADDDTGFFLGASLFDRVSESMTIYQEEIFGPVMVIVRVPDYTSALNLINRHPYGNGAAIFTQNGTVARHFSRHVSAGMVGINVPIPVPIASHPFGGWKRSVFGDTPMHAEEGLRFYTRSKSITSRWSSGQFDPSFQMPTHN